MKDSISRRAKPTSRLWIPLTDRLKTHLDGLARTDGTVVTDAKGRPSELPDRCGGNAHHQEEDEAREGELLQNARAQEKCDDRAVSGWM